MNNKGVLMRDIIFMLITFAGVMSLMTLMVFDMSSSYSNSNMTDEYEEGEISTLGGMTASEINTSVKEMQEAAEGEEGLIGSFLNLADIMKGASTIVKIGFGAPFIVADAVSIGADALGVPEEIRAIVYWVVTLLLYALLIFVIITAALRGSKL